MGINSTDFGDADTGTEHQAEGRFKQFEGKAREAYGDLAGDWSEQFNGNVEQAMGWLQEQYGDAKEKLGEFWQDTAER